MDKSIGMTLERGVFSNVQVKGENLEVIKKF